jgi:hypothetical protein
LKFVTEETMFKLLIERNGALLSITTKRRAFFLFLTGRYVGLKVAPTTDPYPGIVELSNYDVLTILRNWKRLSSLKLKEAPGSGG